MVSRVIPTASVPETEQLAGGTGFTFVNTFNVDEDGKMVTHLSYRRNVAGRAMATRLQLWDWSTRDIVRNIAVPAGDGSVGWHDIAISEYPLVNGRTYAVGGIVPAANYRNFFNSGQTAEAPINYSQSWRHDSSVNPPNTPATATNQPGFSAVIDDDPNPPVGTQDIRNELAAWLDEDDFTEPDSMVALLWQHLQTMETILNATKAKTDELDALLETALGPVGNLAVGALRGFIDDLIGKIDDVQAAVGPFINDHTTAAKDEVLTAIEGIPTGGGGLVPLFDGGVDWTQADQTVGQGSFAWVQPADAYVIHVEDMAESSRSERAVGAEEIYWLRGWAKPWDGARWGPEHIVVNGLTQVVQGVRRWDGIGFWLPPDVEWTITAYDYTP